MARQVSMGHTHVLGLETVDRVAEAPTAFFVFAIPKPTFFALFAFPARRYTTAKNPIADPESFHFGTNLQNVDDPLMTQSETRFCVRDVPAEDVKVRPTYSRFVNPSHDIGWIFQSRHGSLFPRVAERVRFRFYTEKRCPHHRAADIVSIPNASTP
jgi:hypothetical protein